MYDYLLNYSCYANINVASAVIIRAPDYHFLHYIFLFDYWYINNHYLTFNGARYAAYSVNSDIPVIEIRITKVHWRRSMKVINRTHHLDNTRYLTMLTCLVMLANEVLFHNLRSII